MPHRRIALASLVVACALVFAVPAATAGAKTTARWQTNTAKADKAIAELKAQLATLGATVSKLDQQSGVIALLAGAAPQIVDGLTQLKNGLTTLGDAYQAVEYGITQVNVYGGSAVLVNPPSWSSDIPDDGNGASTSGTATMLNAGPPRAVVLSVNAYIRSAEANITGATGPVGQAGATLTIRDQTGAFVPCSNQPATAGIAITPMGETINTPSGPVRNLPLTNIRSAMVRTDQTLPGGDAPQLTSCAFTAAAGAYYTASFTASFLDIPTTLTPGPRD